jgi:hypothetical protein
MAAVQYEPLVKALALMQGRGPAEQKKQAHGYLEDFQKSVSVANMDALVIAHTLV